MNWLRRQSFVLLLCGAVFLAFLFPLSAEQSADRLFSLSADLAVALIFFLQGLSFATKQMLAGRSPLRLFVFVLSWNFIVFPVLTVLFGPFLSYLLGPELRLGFWMLAILPTTVASAAALAAAAGGAVPQAVFSSIVSNLMAVLLVPILALVYFSNTSGLEIELVPVLSKLIWIVVLPLLAGQCLRRCCRQICLRIRQRTRWMPQAAILYLVYLSFAKTVSNGILEQISIGLMSGTLAATALLLCGLSWAVWWSSRFLRLKPAERIAAFYLASQKSVATGLPLLTAVFAATSPSFSTGIVLVPLLIYHPLQLLLGGWLIPRFRSYAASARPETAPNAQS